MDPFRGADIGAYRLDVKVGEGAYGAVWCGTHQETGERAAFKVLLPAAAASAEQVARFHREADLLARVRSRNIARMIDFVVDDRFGVVLVMELIVGELVSDRFDASPLSIGETIDLGVQMLAGVRDLHEVGVIHRDLKPNNVMLSTDPSGRGRVVIFDLGLGRLVRSVREGSPAMRSLTPSFIVLGTLACVAPEQILSARDVTERADLYAVGTILFRGLAGHYPFTSTDLRELAQQKLTGEAPPVPVDPSDPIAVRLREIVGKSIRRRPAERYDSATSMLDELQGLEAAMWAAGRPLQA